jgi:hypothetical protein
MQLCRRSSSSRVSKVCIGLTYVVDLQHGIRLLSIPVHGNWAHVNVAGFKPIQEWLLVEIRWNIEFCREMVQHI